MTSVVIKDKKRPPLSCGTTHVNMVLIPLVPRPLGRLRLLALTSAGVQAAKTPAGVQPPTGAAPPASGAPSPAGCEDASDAEEDAALALRFGFHI